MQGVAGLRQGTGGRWAWSRAVTFGLAAIGVTGCLTKENPEWLAGAGSGSSTTTGPSATTATSETTQMATSTTSTAGTASTAGTTSGGGSSSTGGGPLDVCDETDPDLVACYDLVGSDGGGITDLSMYGHHGTAVNVQLEPSPTGWAVRGGPDTQLSVPDGGELELTTALTLEAWVWLDSVPVGSRSGVIDNDGQYSLILFPDQGWGCGAGGSTTVGTPPDTGRWTHVACVYADSSQIVFVDGVQVIQETASSPLNTRSTEPISLADTSPAFDEPLDGLLDVVRIWRVALTAQEICEAAGNDPC